METFLKGDPFNGEKKITTLYENKSLELGYD